MFIGVQVLIGVYLGGFFKDGAGHMAFEKEPFGGSRFEGFWGFCGSSAVSLQPSDPETTSLEPFSETVNPKPQNPIHPTPHAPTPAAI